MTGIPKTTWQWNVVGTDGVDSLQFSEQPVPELGDTQVLVKIQGASLNYRDLLVVKGQFPFGQKDNIVPGSDGAGTVLAVGRHVTRFRPGDRVVTLLLTSWLGGGTTMQNAARGLGASVDGTLRRVGAFDEQALVPMPAGLTFVEAATLSCAGVTAWNVLFGGGRPLTAGQWVLSQGTGGVGLFVVQFARLVGARVIATTSSEDKAELLRRLGAEHVINYRETEDWGEEAKRYTGGVGVDLAVDVTGPSGLEQSVKSLRLDGVITAVGSVGPSDGTVPTVFDTWTRLFTARGVWAGSRLHMEDMCRAIEGNLDRVRPVVDSKVFGLDELKEAYEYLGAGKHRGNVCIAIQD